MHMKRKLIALLMILAGLMLVTGVALAADDPVKVSMDLSSYEFSEPGEITVSIQISNKGDTELPGAVTLYYPDQTQITEFGEPVLAAGAQKSWTGTWQVTQQQLQEGRVVFRVRYSYVGDDGTIVTKAKNFGKTITYTGGIASMEVNRTITPTTADNGQKVSVTYEIVNTGTMPITNLTITENKAVSETVGRIDQIAAGEKASYTFTVTMAKKDITSQATIKYTAGGKEYTATKEKATIKYGEVKLKGTLTSDKKGGTAGETIKLSLTLKNSGKTAYTNIVVTDPTLGEVFTVESLEGGKSLTLDKELTLSGNLDLQFNITAENTDGSPVETATDRLALTMLDGSQLINLSVEATVESEIVYSLPSIVRFRVYVTNHSTSDVTDVRVSASGLTLYTFPTILAGETREFTRDVSIQMAGQYQFVATCRDQLNQSVSFDSNIIRIIKSNPTPVPTEVPIPVPAEPDYVDVPSSVPNTHAGTQRTLGIVGLVFTVIAVTGFILCCVAVAVRMKVAGQNRKALDRLNESSVRDYENESDAALATYDTAPEAEPLPNSELDPDPADLVKPSDTVDASDDTDKN